MPDNPDTSLSIGRILAETTRSAERAVAIWSDQGEGAAQWAAPDRLAIGNWTKRAVASHCTKYHGWGRKSPLPHSPGFAECL